jgi:ABC-type multidrug transport system fused ATPase/permease subunit
VGPLDPGEQTAVLDGLIEASSGRTLIWALSRSDLAQKFDHVLVMRAGHVVEQGSFSELRRDGRALDQLVAAE